MPPVVSTSILAAEADRAAILLNPKAGRTDARERAERLAALLRRRGFHAELFTDRNDAAATANAWHREGRLRALVGVGGDGTAADLVNLTDHGAPVTLLPAGNSNLLARYFLLGKTPERLCETIAGGVVARVDAGRANGRLFLLMASCGFDAEVVRRLHEQRTGHASTRSYFKHIAGAIRHYEYPEVRVRVEPEGGGQASEWTARWFFAFNLPCYGGGFRVTPWADGSDGLLDVFAFRHGRFWPGLALAAAVLLGRHRNLGGSVFCRAGKIRLDSPSRVPYQLDGDPGGYLPLELEALPGRMSLLIPAEAAAASKGND